MLRPFKRDGHRLNYAPACLRFLWVHTEVALRPGSVRDARHP
jgi:hypothetical protein